MIFDFLPKEATPREVAILTFYYILEIKDPKEIAKIMNYKDASTVWRTLKKYRGRVFFPFGTVIIQLQDRLIDPKDAKIGSCQ